jgi:SAM-dependent methyltransferase
LNLQGVDMTTPAINHHADHRGFTGVAGFLTALVMLIRGRPRAGLVVDLAHISDDDRVVDIGCGPGNAVRAAARRGARVTGVDPAPMMLRLARAVTRGQPGVTWTQGTAEALPVPDDSATVAWSLATVHHWKDISSGLAEAKRVLAPKGRFLAIERRIRPGATGLASHGWTDEQVRSFAQRCRDAGFETVELGEHRLGRVAVWVVEATL